MLSREDIERARRNNQERDRLERRVDEASAVMDALREELRRAEREYDAAYREFRAFRGVE